MLSAMPVVLIAYALILVAGGAMGTIKSANHEVYSILGSLFFGAFAVWGAALIRNGTARTGLSMGLIDAVAVAAFFAVKYFASTPHKTFPALPTIGLSAIVIVLSLIAYASLSRSTV